MKKKTANIYDAIRVAAPSAKGESPQLGETVASALAVGVAFELSLKLQERMIASNERIAAALEKIASVVDDERFLRIIFSSTSASRPKKPE